MRAYEITDEEEKQQGRHWRALRIYNLSIGKGTVTLDKFSMIFRQNTISAGVVFIFPRFSDDGDGVQRTDTIMGDKWRAKGLLHWANFPCIFSQTPISAGVVLTCSRFSDDEGDGVE